MSHPFSQRHVGVNSTDQAAMLDAIGAQNLDELIDQAVPYSIRSNEKLNVPDAMSEHEYLRHAGGLAAKNLMYRSFIGQGYYDTYTPAVIQRNIFENPGWYTQYTPYQAEISQGRLEALLNFQTAVADLTGLPIANASLLDEATAAVEAMMLFYNAKSKKKDDRLWHFYMDKHCFAHTIDVVKTRAETLGVEVVVCKVEDMEISDATLGALVQYPDCTGDIHNYQKLGDDLHASKAYLAVAADVLALTLLKAPGEWGADAVLGSTQRFGVPMGYGGPHAAYFATTDKFKRKIPGRIIGISQDRLGNPALRMALQTREQHIRRDKATSNICTAQALLAIMAGMYTVYHGPEGLHKIASDIATKTARLRASLIEGGYKLINRFNFDTLTIKVDSDILDQIKNGAKANRLNLFYSRTGYISISLDETTTQHDLEAIERVFQVKLKDHAELTIPDGLKRDTAYLEHEIFHKYRSETEMMRYIKRLENKDISLVHSMIPLGSCTMKLNSAAELFPVSWPEFSKVHPFTPDYQMEGYLEMIRDLETYLSRITGFAACSLMPNSGAQGEYSGLLTIKKYHEAAGQSHRDVVLIPSSAHGTNPASAVISGLRVVVVKCDDQGNIDLGDLKARAVEYQDELCALMVTYPSTHGVFEKDIIEICDTIHAQGGLVYMDGANMNAQVGLTSPGLIHADVCHLNLHKTFAIPHGGGGPGMGPICVNEKLAPHLPKHIYDPTRTDSDTGAVASARFGSASILLISYAYIRMLGPDGLVKSTEIAILNANYIKSRLADHFPVLYSGDQNRVAHELIIDMRPFKAVGVQAEDVAKRLMDYNFHSPTLSFPVAGTLMIEPTESESKGELDRFIDAMIAIKGEIDSIASGESDQENNALINAPHTMAQVVSDNWEFPYSRSQAAFPLPYILERGKIWATVARVDNAYGDRNLICTCAPIEDYME